MILLRGGTIIAGDDDGTFIGLARDVLVEGNTIVKIAEHEQIPDTEDSCEVIDCRGTIISPGFIDTHRHMWQTQLKTKHADETFEEYACTGMTAASHYTAADVFWGEIGAAMECIDVGTTTVVDHAHMVYSAEHARAGISALVASGLRASFCLTPAADLQRPDCTDGRLLPDWFYRLLTELAAENPWAGDRIRLGFGFDGFQADQSLVSDLYGRLRRFGLAPLSSHHFPGRKGMDAVNPLSRAGLLGPDVLITHACGLDSTMVKNLADANVSISATPIAESLLGMGDPVCFDQSFPCNVSLGVDNQSLTTAFMPEQARCALQLARSREHSARLRFNKPLSNSGLTVQEAFAMLTTRGAKAIGMEGMLGSITEGKRADLVIFAADTPSMAPTARMNPVAAILLHSSPRDVDTVIIDGVICKSGGVLKQSTGPDDAHCTFGSKLQWSEISQALSSSCDAVSERMKSGRS